MTLLKGIKMMLKRHIKTNLWAGETVQSFTTLALLAEEPTKSPRAH